MASIKNCNACSDLQEDSADFVQHGVTSTVCNSLKNDTGLNPSSGHDDCEDLDTANDCLIGNMEDEVEYHDVCEWKEFMPNFIHNLWSMLKIMICSICGMWTQIHCTYNSLVKLVNYLADTTSAATFVTYYRDLGTGGDSVPYWNNITDGFERTLDIYMDSSGASSGSEPADRDYAVLISNCTNYRYFQKMQGTVSFYSSGDNRSVSTIRSHVGQHPNIFMTNSDHLINFSWTTSGAVILKKGEHIKINFYVSSADAGGATADEAPSARLHQFVLTWIPINAGEALDPSKILKC